MMIATITTMLESAGYTVAPISCDELSVSKDGVALALVDLYSAYGVDGWVTLVPVGIFARKYNNETVCRDADYTPMIARLATLH